MIGASFLRHLHQVPGRELADFAEALCALVAASAAIKLLPFKAVVRTMNHGLGQPQRPVDEYGELAAGVRRAVKRASTWLPWRIVCFPEGLAAH